MQRTMYWVLVIGLSGIVLAAAFGLAAVVLGAIMISRVEAGVSPDLAVDTVLAISRTLVAISALYFVPKAVRRYLMEPS